MASGIATAVSFDDPMDPAKRSHHLQNAMDAGMNTITNAGDGTQKSHDIRCALAYMGAQTLVAERVEDALGSSPQLPQGIVMCGSVPIPMPSPNTIIYYTMTINGVSWTYQCELKAAVHHRLLFDQQYFQGDNALLDMRGNPHEDFMDLDERGRYIYCY